MLIRRPRPDELAAITAMVRSVVTETFPGANPADIDRLGADDWSPGWIAVAADGSIAGVTLVTEEWIDDLWVARAHRSHGVGALLLAHAEVQIAALGHSEARLRLVSNAAARKFYAQHGYTVVREFDHERFKDRKMVELEKKLG